MKFFLRSGLVVNDTTDESRRLFFYDFFIQWWCGEMALADGSDKMQAEVRLVQRIGDADAALHESRLEVRGGRAIHASSSSFV